MDQYAVFGNPISHSKSPAIHTMFAKQTQQAMEYGVIEAPLDGFEKAVGEFIHRGGQGANVTLPFKQQAFALADQLSEAARLAGAVNTLSFNNGRIYGDNTDGKGLVADLKLQGVTLTDARILLLGAGGAARGVIAPLLSELPASIHVANRTEQRAVELVAQNPSSQLVASGLDNIEGEFDLVINASSASLAGSVPSIRVPLVADAVCYDMVYAATVTPFNLWARQHGASRTVDGLGMLVCQAAESFAIWRGVRPDVNPVMQFLRAQMTQSL